MRTVKIICLFWMSLLVVAFAVGACSDSKQDEEKLQVSKGEDEELDELGSEEAADATVDVEPEVMEEEAAEEVVVDETPAPAAPAIDMTGRVVRYVKENGVAVHASPDASSSVVGNLKKGDVVVVVEQGEWSQLANGKFIKNSDLSAKGIGRERKKAVWK